MVDPRRENPIRAVHDAAAASTDDVEASTRPAGTTNAELRRMVTDVREKLAVTPTMSLVEIGCGTGVLGLPLARTVARYLGVDFSAAALDVLRHRIAEEGLAGRCELVCMDILAASDEEVRALGTFDRVLVYATLHYVASDEELRRFLARAIGMVAPGGLALFGSLPVDDSGVGPPWLASTAYRAWRRGRRLLGRTSAPGPALPAGTTMSLTAAALEDAVENFVDVTFRWVAPRVGTPMFARRVDLLVSRRDV